MSQIALHDNVATGTIHRYFNSKDGLIIELFKYCREKTNLHIFSFNEDLPYKEKFFFIWNRLVDYYIAHKETFWFIEQFYSRSEEHTSELQSRENIVCRLLLEKKNKK